jgi:hypothetical protein
VRGAKIAGGVYTLALFLGVAAAFVDPVAAFVIYAIVITVIVVATLVGRADWVLTLPVGRRRDRDEASG